VGRGADGGTHVTRGGGGRESHFLGYDIRGPAVRWVGGAGGRGLRVCCVGVSCRQARLLGLEGKLAAAHQLSCPLTGFRALQTPPRAGERTSRVGDVCDLRFLVASVHAASAGGQDRDGKGGEEDTGGAGGGGREVRRALCGKGGHVVFWEAERVGFFMTRAPGVLQVSS